MRIVNGPGLMLPGRQVLHEAGRHDSDSKKLDFNKNNLGIN
jgi:hypothetical protein